MTPNKTSSKQTTRLHELSNFIQYGKGDFESSQTLGIRKDKALKFQRTYTPSKNVRMCGRGVLKKYERADISVYEDRSVSFAGLSSCGAHYCAHCASNARKNHAEAIGKGLNQALKEGKKIWFGTLTIATCEMAKQVGLMRDAWRAFQLRLNRELGKLGIETSIYKAYDFTINENKRASSALHLHIHFVFVAPDHDGVEAVLNGARQFFVRKVRKSGGSAVEIAQQIEPARDAEAVAFYTAKLVKELSNSATKTKTAKVGGGLSLVPWIYKVSQETDEKKNKKNVRIYRSVVKALTGLRIFSKTKAFGELIKRAGEITEEPKEEKAIVYTISVGPRALSALAEINRLNEFGEKLSRAVFSENPRLKLWLLLVEEYATASLKQEANDFLLDEWKDAWLHLLRTFGSNKFVDRSHYLASAA
jgi:hypothetical protein